MNYKLIKTQTLQEEEIFMKYHPSEGILEGIATGYMYEDVFQERGEALLRIAEERGVKRMLLSCEVLNVLKPSNQLYLRDHWFPALYRLGVKKVAIVEPIDMLSNCSLKQAVDLMGAMNTKEFYQYFSARDQAIAWLKA
ncbi:hypothetical protein [Persicobacter psychrovividus]|uniref:STAS/SEC14 domain-containing protein n=1 Tax=Persicobacter psychrovividus TaxID=387638 RepID=A0ABN6L5B6_9BACT|nr:hypothetical protein PEPS_06160 [Persicobacter psychrovividus]